MPYGANVQWEYVQVRVDMLRWLRTVRTRVHSGYLQMLRARSVAIIAEPFILPTISRKLAFFADPFGNLIELAEELP